jgi:hypothetical protein
VPANASARPPLQHPHQSSPGLPLHLCTFCDLNVSANASTCFSGALINTSPGSCPIVAIVATDHTMFATVCVLNVPATAYFRPSSTLIIPASGSRPIVAYAHSVFSTVCVN